MRIASLLVLSLAACGGSGSSTPDAADDCTNDPRAETFFAGIDHHGDASSLDFVIVSADPAPPARPNNTWVLQVNGMSAGVVGAPQTGVAMAVTPFMPDHQHGTPIPVNITTMPTAGQYQLSPINTWMPGLWTVTIQAQSGSVSDQTTFSFCIKI